jgi:hypothetical protein
MSHPPLISVAKWRTIQAHLPASYRDRHMISAIVFRQVDGASLRQVCEWYHVTRTRLAEWTVALDDSGDLARILKALKLERAAPAGWRHGGGPPSWRRYSRDGGRAVVELKLGRFAEQLRTGRD